MSLRLLLKYIMGSPEGRWVHEQKIRMASFQQKAFKWHVLIHTLVKSRYTKKKIPIYTHRYVCNVYLSLCIYTYTREGRRKICLPIYLRQVILQNTHRDWDCELLNRYLQLHTNIRLTNFPKTTDLIRNDWQLVFSSVNSYIFLF